MANLAHGKTPVEEWRTPGQATNGIVDKYTGNEGFASQNHPCTYTLAFKESISVKVIRFLLWDGLGDGKTRTERKYRYMLQTSEDNSTWYTHYETSLDGTNGWQVFTFQNSFNTKFVRFVGLHNTANKAIHIVEFEVHDSTPLELKAEIMLSQVLLGTPISDEYNQLLRRSKKELDEEKSGIRKIVEEITGLRNDLKTKDLAFEKAISDLDLIGKTKGFNDQAVKNKANAMWWFAGVCISFIPFIWLLSSFWDSTNSDILQYISDLFSKKASESMTGVVDNLIIIDYIKMIVLKIIALSISIFLISFTIKNYNAQKHNQTINNHKANSLFSMLSLLMDEEIKDGKEDLLKQVANAIFSHQKSGYIGKDAEGQNPNILANFIDGVKEKIPS